MYELNKEVAVSLLHKPYQSSDSWRMIVKVIIIFFLGSFLGWCYETINDLICGRGLMLRAVFLAPFCPIYGIGCVLSSIACFNIFKRGLSLKTVAISALVIVTLTTTLELLASYYCEITMGFCPWDYSDYFLNFQGRIALKSSIIFTVGGVIVSILSLKIDNFVEADINTSTQLILILIIVFLIDIFMECAGLNGMIKKVILTSNPNLFTIQQMQVI